MTDPSRDRDTAQAIDPLTRAIELVAGVILIVLTGLVLYAIAMRYLLSAPPIWAEDVPRVLFVWCTYLAILSATRRDINIRVTYFIDKLPTTLRCWIDLTMHAFVLALLVILIVYSWPVIALNMGSTMLSTGWPDVVTFIPLPLACVGLALMTVRKMRQIWRTRGAGGAA